MTHPAQSQRWQDQEDAFELACDSNPRFKDILENHLPLVMRRFAQKCLDYGDAADELGPRAQFVDINRKIKKLKRFLWDGQSLIGEQPIEILDDLIAHCLLTREMLLRGDACSADDNRARFLGNGLIPPITPGN